MNVSGPVPVPQVQRPDEAAIAVRINQRFSAEVLQVQGDRVVLAVEGVRVVARLMASDQAAALVERRTAQFVVRDTSSSTVVLQLLSPEGSGAQPAAGSNLQELIPNLLQHAGLPVERATVEIARALLNHGFQVTPENVAELLETLSQLQSWGASQAEVAAALKSLGLPLNAGSLALMQQSLPALDTLLGGLRDQLRVLLNNRSASPRLSEAAQKMLAILDTLTVEVGGSGEGVAEKLRQAVAVLGRPLEHDLGQLLQKNTQNLNLSPAERSLLALALLRREMAPEAPQSLLEKLDGLLEGLRRMAFLNSEPETPPARGQWLRLDLPLALPGEIQAGHETPLQTAHLRVAYRGEGDAPEIDPANTRFVVRLALASGECSGETLQVDVSIAGQRVGALVTASSEALRQHAEGELPSLRKGLEGLGYDLRSAQCEMGSLKPAQEVDGPGFWTSYNEVSVEA